MQRYEWLFYAASMKQSRVMSLIEAVANVVVAYVVAIESQMVVFPWFRIETGLAEHLTISLAFVGVSLVRGYSVSASWRATSSVRSRNSKFVSPS